MEIIQAIMTKNPSYTRNRSIKPVGVFVHATGANNRNLKRYVDYEERLGKNTNNNHWNKKDADKSVHAFIGCDKNSKVIVAQTLPYDRACWGAGGGSKGSYNYDPQAHIQFEICQGSNSDADYYWKAIGVAEEYCAYLCNMYGWSADKITSHVEAHKAGYASNHADPVSWMKCFGDNMDKFRARVKARISGENSPSDAPAEKDKETPAQKPSASPAATYTVKGGDTLWDIAKKELGDGSRYKEIMELNGMTSTTIHKGDVLKLPANGSAEKDEPIIYTVKSGDTLWDIAAEFLGSGSRYKEIKELNGLTSNTIYKGQKLKIPQ